MYQMQSEVGVITFGGQVSILRSKIPRGVVVLVLSPLFYPALTVCFFNIQQCSQARDMKLFGDLIVKVSRQSLAWCV